MNEPGQALVGVIGAMVVVLCIIRWIGTRWP